MKKQIALVIFVLLLSQWLQAGHLHAHDAIQIDDCALWHQVGDDAVVADTLSLISLQHSAVTRTSFYQSRFSSRVYRLPTARAPPKS